MTPPTDDRLAISIRRSNARSCAASSADPARRPASALAVSAALPGGDPLAAALAAGETPSPEMVAAAGDVRRASTARAGALLVVALVALLGLAGPIADRSTVAGQTAMRKPAAVLADTRVRCAAWRAAPARRRTKRSVSIRRRCAPLYAAHGGPSENWRRIGAGKPPVVRFCYRASQSRIAPRNPIGSATLSDPPAAAPGDVTIELDAEARLLRFTGSPASRMSSEPPRAAPDWPAFFKAAGLDIQTFSSTPSARTPPFFADTLVSWQGRAPLWPAETMRVDAASLDGHPVSFVVTGPWTEWQPPSASVAARVAAIASPGSPSLWCSRRCGSP